MKIVKAGENQTCEAVREVSGEPKKLPMVRMCGNTLTKSRMKGS